ncbi:MAG: TRAP transporter small permease [Betaproteobacteria bacterium]|nr:TRAP transporter small permease [Betaproteobacteria bacterium]
MKFLTRSLQATALGLLLLGAVGLILSMVIGFADVVGTKFLDNPVPGTLEFTESTMVLVVFGALAFTQSRRGHIRVEIFYNFGGPRTRALLDAFTHAIAFLYFGLLCWSGIQEAIYSWEISEASMGTIRFPLFPARALLATGTALLLVQLVVDIASDLSRAFRGDEGKSEPPPDTQAFQ